jgi:hypothetical protein
MRAEHGRAVLLERPAVLRWIGIVLRQRERDPQSEPEHRHLHGVP